MEVVWEYVTRIWRNERMVTIGRRISFLQSDVTLIEARFGSAIGTYFRMFRTQVIVNLCVAFGIIICVIPFIVFQFLDPDYSIMDSPIRLIPNRTESLVVPTVLSFRSFQKLSTFTNYNKLVYFLMVFPAFMIFTLTLFLEIVVENKHKIELETKARDVENKQFLSMCLNMWDYRLTNRKDIMNSRYELLGELKILLLKRKKEDEILKRTTSQKICLLLRKIFGWTTLVLIIGTTWTILIALNIYKSAISSLLKSWLKTSDFDVGLCV